MRSRTVFISGTDTGVGKTFVSCGLLEAAIDAGLQTGAVKPLAAGAEKTAKGLRNDDAVALLERSTVSLDYEEVNPYCFERPIAPHIAAAEQRRPVRVADLLVKCRRVMDKVDGLTVIEGAGGWFLPVNEKEFLGDLVKKLEIPVILVVGMRLGCLNHALLSADRIKREGLELLGWVANSIDPDMDAYEENLESLEKRLDAPCLGQVAYRRPGAAMGSCARELDLKAVI